MKKNNSNDKSCKHSKSCGCGCTPEVFVNMIESAGLELSRREFIKGAGALGGMLAFGAIMPTYLDASESIGKDAKADTIYHGGPIVTMKQEGDIAESLAVWNGQIIAVGKLKDVMTSKDQNTKMIDLKGKTLMPGFFDPHSHVVMQSIKFSTANLDPKPIGEAGSIADIQRILKDWIKEKKIEAGKWVIGWGYDDTGIEEQRHPTKEDLDKVSTEHPILLMHISSHLMTGNSKMLELIGVNTQTKDPDGGVIQRKSGSNEPNGVLEENAMYLVLKSMPMPTPERAMGMLEEGLQYYAKAGITTAQDCATFKGTWHLLAKMEKLGKLPIDVIAWPMYKGVDDDSFDAIVANKGKRGRLRLGGVKLTVDGSIQGYTAFLSKPYHIQPKGVEITADKCDSEKAERIFVSEENKSFITDKEEKSSKGHVGYASMTQEQIDHWVKRCDDHDLQMQVHTNGDAATDMLIKAVEKVRAKKPRPDLRTTIIHAQTMRNDQLDFSSKHGLTPSFFPIHVYFWGDRHRDLFLGEERAKRIDPARSALDRKLKMTLHHDAPIAGIEMLKVAWAAVTRVTTSGKVLGPEERITPFEALRAITADAAWQNFEEDRKGTLEKGKLADLVVLSDNPLNVDPMAIKDIKIMETIKEGKTVYSADIA
jgi:predicted amidohydrolase YtcJ